MGGTLGCAPSGAYKIGGTQLLHCKGYNKHSYRVCVLTIDIAVLHVRIDVCSRK